MFKAVGNLFAILLVLVWAVSPTTGQTIRAPRSYAQLPRPILKIASPGKVLTFPRTAKPRLAHVLPFPPAKKRLAKRAKHGVQLARGAMAGAAGCASGSYPAPILALASSLKCDPDLLYEYVYNNIEFEPLYGSNKGALGTLLDRRGNAADQAILLVTLFNASGYTNTGYYNEAYTYSGAQITGWLGVPNDGAQILSLLYFGGITYGTFVCTPDQSCNSPGSTLLSIQVASFAAGVQIGGVWYAFDPSYKMHTISAGLPAATLASAMGCSQTKFLADAGGTTTSNSISNVNRANIRADLTSFASNLVNYINSNNRTWTIGNLIGGKTISPLTGSPIRIVPGFAPSATFPVNCPNQTTTVECRTFVSITMPGASSSHAIKLYTDQVYGHRITIFSVPSGSNYIPTLLIDGAPPSCVAGGTCTNVGPATPAGTAWSVNTQLVQPNQAATTKALTINAGGSYLVSLGVGQVGRGMAEYHRQLLAQARATGNSDSSEPVLGEGLAVISYNWLAQLSSEQRMTDGVAQTTTLYNYALGITGQSRIQSTLYQGPYVDLPINQIHTPPLLSGGPTTTIGPYSYATAFWASEGATASALSSLESAVLLQTQAPVPNITAASTVMLVDANMNSAYPGAGKTTYYADGTTAAGVSNYFCCIRGNLSGYSSTDLTTIDYLISTTGTSAGSPAGHQVLLPSNGALVVLHWSGWGYTDIYPQSSSITISQMISGGMSGGFLGANDTTPALFSQTTLLPPANTNTLDLLLNQIPKASDPRAQEPVDAITGAYLYTHDDLVTGGPNFPYALAFSRTYISSSGSYKTTTAADAGMGNGWAHTYSISAQVVSDPYIGMGQADSPAVSAATSIAALFVSQDLLSSTPTAQTMTLSAMVTQWFTDQLTNNTVMVSQPDTVEEFVALPHADGATSLSFSPPPGSSDRLNQSSAGSYTYQQKNGESLNFAPSPSGWSQSLLTSWAFPSGVAINLSYSGAQLTKVSNNLGRSLTLAYSGADITTVTDDTGRSVNFSYDANHNLTQFTDALGAGTTYSYDTSGTYDSQGHLTQVYYPSNPGNAFVTNAYDAMGRVLAQSNANGNVSYFYVSGPRTELVDAIGNRHVTYQTDRGHVIKDAWVLSGSADVFSDTVQRNGVVNVTTNQYDGSDRLLLTTKPEGDSVAVTYDGVTNPWANNVASIKHSPKPGSPLSPITQSFTYDATWNKPTVSVDALGLVTDISYDPATGNTVRTIADAGSGHFNATSIFTYNSVGQVLTATDPLGVVTSYTYDGFGNRNSMTRDAGSGRLNQLTSMGYSSLGDVVSLTDPNGNTTTNTYDSNRRLIDTVQPSAPNLETTYSYDPNGQLLQTQQLANGSVLRSASSTYTLTGEVSTITDANGNVISRAYDADDRLSSVTDPVGNVTSYTYDAVSRPVKTFNLAIQAAPLLQLAYTPNGLRASLGDAKPNTTSYAYDGLDRLSALTYPDTSKETYTYDADGNVLTRKTRKGDTIAFTYDTLNRLSSKMAPGEATVSYNYDMAGHLIAVNDNSAAVAVPAGAGASFVTTTAYDAVNRPINVSWNPAPVQAAPTASSVTFTHGYDANNRRISQSANDTNWWNYPAVSSSTAYTVNSLNQYTAVGAVTPTYDGNGNLTSDGTNSYCYDAESRLTSILSAGTCASPTTTVATYAYDAQGRRKSKTVGSVTTLFVTDADDREVLEYDGSGAVQNWYAYGQGSNDVLNQMNVAAGTRQTFAPDIQGSIIGALDSGTGTLSKTGYQVFGENPGLTSGTFNYTAQRLDAETAGSTSQPSGLYYYRARMYSPTWGRFLQPDPIGYAGGVNLYAYVGNDPLNATDLWGLAADGPQRTNVFQTLYNAVLAQPVNDVTNLLNHPYEIPGAIADALTPIAPAAGELSLLAKGGVAATEEAAPLLPDFVKGGKTAGVLRTSAGDTVLQSGWSGPASSMSPGSAGFDIVTRTHVEGHAAALMQQQGVTEGTLYLNNPVICSSCTRLLPRMLAPGSNLNIVLPNGTITPFTGATP
jgi:RHS repeat-associated protein